MVVPITHGSTPYHDIVLKDGLPTVSPPCIRSRACSDVWLSQPVHHPTLQWMVEDAKALFVGKHGVEEIGRECARGGECAGRGECAI